MEAGKFGKRLGLLGGGLGLGLVGRGLCRLGLLGSVGGSLCVLCGSSAVGGGGLGSGLGGLARSLGLRVEGVERTYKVGERVGLIELQIGGTLQ